MENPLLSLLQKKNLAAQLYGLPGTYKTTVLLQIIHKRLQEGHNSIYLIDTSNNFPIVRLKPIKHLLQKLIVFQPKTVEEEAFLLDDLSCQLLSQKSLLLIDDVFRHTNLEDKANLHLNSYILAQIKAISRKVDFPVILTNQARSYDNNIHPFLQSLTLHYLDWHFLFEKTQDTNQIRITFFDQDQYISQWDHKISKTGFLSDIK
ncbi:MAG: NB-ARC domain-containing protein [Promethearchaeota archaeon]